MDALWISQIGPNVPVLQHQVCRSIPATFVCLDDILVASTTPAYPFHTAVAIWPSHQPDKCKLGTSLLEFLGHHINTAGIGPLEDHIEAIFNFPSPQNETALQEYLGLSNFYHHFFPSCANILHPTTNYSRARRPH